MTLIATDNKLSRFLLLDKNLARWLIIRFKENKLKKGKRVRKSCRSSAKDYAEKKSVARKLIEKKIEIFNNFYNFKFGRIAVRNQKTRWGSCSSKKNLNFNYRIVYLPENLADYIIVHELCHLKELNHTQKFWTLVSQTLPDYKELKKKLKTFPTRPSR